MLYNGLVEPEEIYGEPVAGLAAVRLFGGDFSGYNAGFDTHNWSVVEIDPTTRSAVRVAGSFEEFIRRKIAALGS